MANKQKAKKFAVVATTAMVASAVAPVFASADEGVTAVPKAELLELLKDKKVTDLENVTITGGTSSTETVVTSGDTVSLKNDGKYLVKTKDTNKVICGLYFEQGTGEEDAVTYTVKTSEVNDNPSADKGYIKLQSSVDVYVNGKKISEEPTTPTEVLTTVDASKGTFSIDSYYVITDTPVGLVVEQPKADSSTPSVFLIDTQNKVSENATNQIINKAKGLLEAKTEPTQVTVEKALEGLLADYGNKYETKLATVLKTIQEDQNMSTSNVLALFDDVQLTEEEQELVTYASTYDNNTVKTAKTKLDDLQKAYNDISTSAKDVLAKATPLAEGLMSESVTKDDYANLSKAYADAVETFNIKLQKHTSTVSSDKGVFVDALKALGVEYKAVQSTNKDVIDLKTTNLASVKDVYKAFKEATKLDSKGVFVDAKWEEKANSLASALNVVSDFLPDTVVKAITDEIASAKEEAKTQGSVDKDQTGTDKDQTDTDKDQTGTDKDQTGTDTVTKFVSDVKEAFTSQNAKTVGEVLGVQYTSIPNNALYIPEDVLNLVLDVVVDETKDVATNKKAVVDALPLLDNLLLIMDGGTGTYSKTLTSLQSALKSVGLDAKDNKVKDLVDFYAYIANAVGQDGTNPTLDSVSKGKLMTSTMISDAKALLEDLKTNGLNQTYKDLKATLDVVDVVTTLATNNNLTDVQKTELKTQFEEILADTTVFPLTNVVDLYEAVYDEYLKLNKGTTPSISNATYPKVDVSLLASTSQVYTDVTTSENPYMLFSNFATKITDASKAKVTVTIDNKKYDATYDDTTKEWYIDSSDVKVGTHNVAVELTVDNKIVETYKYTNIVTNAGVSEKVSKLVSSLKLAKGKDLVSTDYDIISLAYQASLDGVVETGDFDKGISAITKFKEAKYTGAYADLFLASLELELLNAYTNEKEPASASKLSTALGLSLKDTTLNDKDITTIVKDVIISKTKAGVTDALTVVKGVKEAINGYSLVMTYVSNPTTDNYNKAYETLKTVDTASKLSDVLTNVKPVIDIMNKTGVTLTELEAVKTDKLGTDAISQFTLTTYKALQSLLKFEEKKETYKKDSDSAKLVDKYLADSYATKDSTLYKAIKERYEKVRTENGETLQTITTTNGVTKVSQTGTFQNKLTFTLDKDNVDKVIKDNIATIHLASNDGLEVYLNTATLGLAKMKETVGSFALESTVEKTTKGLTLSVTAKGEKGNTTITNLGKMTKIVVDTKHLDMSNTKNRLFRVVKNADGSTSKVPVLGKVVRDASNKIIGYEIYTQYLGEFVIEQQDTKINDTDKYYNAEGMKDFVDRGILKMDSDDKFNPSKGISVGDVSDALTVAFGSATSDKTKITEILGSDIPTFIEKRLGEKVSTTNTITREQTASLLVGLFEKQDDSIVKNLKSKTPTGYKDSANINSKAVEDVAKMQELDIMVGKDNKTKFDAKEALTKSQFAKVLRKALIKLKLIDDTIKY